MQALTTKIIKYFAAGLILVLLLKYIPSINLKTSDIGIILVVIVAVQIFLDFICKQQKPTDCYCGPFGLSSTRDGPSTSEPEKSARPKRNIREKFDNKYLNKTKDEDESDEEYESDEETDVPYSQLSSEHYEKMGVMNNPNRHSLRDPKYKDRVYNGEPGDWMIPPEEWYPACTRPPVCTTNNGCPVQPVYTSGTNIDLREFDNSRRITQPENLSVPFIKKLNGGKIKKVRRKKPKKTPPDEIIDS
jgi:hypothetical protein